jgi:NAD dependent epimerase/dehydratase family enzyme
MTATNKFGFGIVLGSGKQYLPWIHIDDLCEIYIHAIENADTTGAYNAVAPEYVTYQSFIVSLITKTGKRSFIFNIPSAIIKMVFGQMSEILLTGNKISSYKIMSTGFTFKFYTLNKALADLKL